MGQVLRGVILCAGVLGLFAASSAVKSATALATDWMFPGRAPHEAPPASDDKVDTVGLPGSPVTFRAEELHDLFRAVDWWPDRHPSPPDIVLRGHAPDAMACGYCHLPGGEGRPENAALAGLPASYILQQLSDIHAGERAEAKNDWVPSRLMRQAVKGVSPSDASAAADYFSKLRFTSHIRVVEAATIPPMAEDAFVFKHVPGDPPMTLGDRIVEGPDDFDRFERRDPTIRYTAFVPPGSIKRGEALAAGGGQAQPCALCHGAAFTGGLGPPLAGRSAIYLFRQLYDFKTGARHGAAGAPMRDVTAALSTKDMIGLAAYMASRKP